MKRLPITIGPILLLLLIISCASGHREPFPADQETKRDLSEYLKPIRKAVESSPLLTMEKAGTVEYPGFREDIWKIVYDPGEQTRFKVLMTAAIHGNEPAGAHIMSDFITNLAGGTDNYRDHRFEIIPIVNPWGYVHDIRFNREGRDINRDFASLKTREAGIIKTILRDRTFDLMIDLHEDPDATGFYIYQYAMPDKRLSEQIIDSVRKWNFPVEENVNMIVLKTENGIIDAPLWGLWYMVLSRQLSMSNYMRLNNSKSVYTIETPTSRAMDKRIFIQGLAVTRILDSLKTGRP